MRLHPTARALLLVVGLTPLSGCLFRSRPVQPLTTVVPLKSATQEELIQIVNTQAAKIQSMQATVDIDTSVGGAKKGKITDYQQIRGYVLARKPTMLRMTGLMPIVRNRAFDMVSDGRNFRLWIPPKNRFVIGRNDEPPRNTSQPLENLRPQVIDESLLIRPIDPERDVAVRENEVINVSQFKGHRLLESEYVLHVMQKGSHGWYLARNIVFSRADLAPHRQMIYNEDGDVVTNVRYDGYKDYNGVSFPSQIEISRPQEEYDITLTMVKLELNIPLPDDRFQLEQPVGVEVVDLDHPHINASTQPVAPKPIKH